MKHRNLLAMSLAFALIFAGCGSDRVNNTGNSNRGNHSGDEHGIETEVDDNVEGEQGTGGTSLPLKADDIFSDRDFETDYDEGKSTVITLNGSSAGCSSDAVEIEGSTVIIQDEGTYILSGNLDDGMIVVDSDKEDKVWLVLKDVDIHSKTSAPIYILQSDKVFITLAEGSKNSLSNGGSFVAVDDNNIDAVIFSKEDLTLNGEGSLTIDSPAGHGVVSKDELTLTGGTYEINSGSHGLSGKDGVGIAGGTYHITSGKDGIHGENDEDSTVGYVYLKDGVVDIISQDDGISAVSRLQIDGGVVNIAAEGDGFHADDTLAVNGGVIHISECYEGLEGLYVEINGGTIDLVAEDDGINAAGGTDSGSFGGKGEDDRFGGKGAKDWFGGRGGERPDRSPRDEAFTRMPGDMQGKRPENMPGGMPGGGGSGSITITGGEIYVKASGDGIDANGSLTISGGSITICGPNHGDTATLDYDTTGVITGGTFIGTGARGMAQSFSDSTQGVVVSTVGDATGGMIGNVGNAESAEMTGNAGTKITLADKNGTVLLECTPELDCDLVIFSSPELVKGETYILNIGGSQSDCTAE